MLPAATAERERMQFEDSPDSVEGWLRLVERSRHICEAVIDNPHTAPAAWQNAGFAVECTLKAAIMAKERLNQFPSRRERKELYTHSLPELLKILGVEVTLDMEMAPAWSVVTRWRREHTYSAGHIPKPMVRGIVNAAFSQEGVIQWISQRFLKGHLPPGKSFTVG